MKIGVIADFVAFGILALQNIRPAVRRIANDEENCRGIFVLEDVEDFRGPAGIGSVVEGKNDFLVGVANLIDIEGKRNFVIRLVGEEIAAASY